MTFVSLDVLLNQPVTVRTLVGETRSDTGASTPVYETAETTMYLEPRSDVQSGEAEGDRNTGIGEWLGVGRVDIEFDHFGQVVYGARVFDIVAPIRPMWNPRSQELSHVEMDLREVT